MASNPLPFQVEDNTDEDFFDKLVNDDDDDVDFKVANSLASSGPNLTDGNESDEVKAFANLSINEFENNGEVNFDDISGSNKRVDDLSAEVETVAQINKVKTVEEIGKPLVPSNSSGFDNLTLKPGNANPNGAEVLSEGAVVSKSTGEGLSDVTSGGSIAPGVKEVEWSAFHADSAQNDSNGFGSYSDFLSEFGGDNAGDASGIMVRGSLNNGPEVSIGNDVYGSTSAGYSNNYGLYNEAYNDIAADQSSNMQDLNSTQYWENQYPGWKYDPNTGEWYQVDGYDAAASVQANVDSNISSTWGVTDGQAELSYMQQTAQSVVGSVAKAGTTESVTNLNQASQASDATESATNWNLVSEMSSNSNAVPSDWNQASHDNNGYPPHMVFDPQYPGWYYDTIAQEWRTLESYPASDQSTAQVQDQINQDGYGTSDMFSANNDQRTYSAHNQGNNYVSQGFGSQGQDMNAGSVSNYNQQSSRMWLPETVASSEATLPYSENHITENHYGENVSVSAHGSQQISGVKGSYYENLSRGQNDFSMASHSVGRNLGPHFSDSQINQNDQNHFLNDYYSNQNPLNFSQIQSAQISYASASGRSSAGRPAHALAAFGFGGKLIVMKHNNTSENMNFGSQNHGGGSISVLNLVEVMNTNIDTSNHGMGVSNYFQALCRQSLPGPLTSGSVGSKELNKWIDEKMTNLESADMDYRKAEILRLLLSLLKIACQYYGKLRSPYGTDDVLKESDAPESAVAKLFASAKGKGSQFSQYDAVAQCLQHLPSEEQMRVTAAEVQNLLVSGRKKDALQCAQDGQLWGPALVLAAQLGDQFYVETVKQMALRQLVAGSPLRTLCLLIAGQPADVFSADSTAISSMPGALNMPQQPAQFSANCMLDDWEENLAVITANRTKDDELVLIHLGDCLWKERSDIIAAHICYLVAEATFEPYSDTARLCLVGADHWKYPRTYASPEAIQRTELYEYSKVLGNSQFVLLPFQPYKFVYALMLAEVGRMSEALKYCQAVSKSLKTGRTPEVETLRHLASSLEERIKAHQQGGFSTNLAPKEFIGKLLNLFDSTAHRVVGGLPPSVPTAGGTLHGNENNHQSVGPRVSTSQSTMAMSSLVPSQSMEPISAWSADGNRMAMHSRSVSEPDFGRSPMQAQPESLRESSSTGKQEKASAGSTSRFGRLSFGSQLFQKTVGLVLKPRQGRQAKLGETNKFYYDEKLKRWVEEGAEPPAEEAALPPPPTTGVFQNGTSDYNLKSALQSEASHSNGSPEFKTPSSQDNNSGMPPLPPMTNQYSARGRMGVRSRYVDTFNQGGRNTATAFQSPSVPSVKTASGVNPKFFVPTPVSTIEQPVDGPVNSMQNTSSSNENPSISPLHDSFESPAPPSSTTMQRFGSMNNLSHKEVTDSGSFPIHSRRTASWSGSLTDSLSHRPNKAELKPLGELLSRQPLSSTLNNPSLVHSAMNGGSFGDDLHEVEL
ncbi:protein transport protein SEC16B homolog [Sesamum indicum]|uniref:Protein transport protein sec16 n=1 Tax=Sesamum indicum TaxID=4182 RepID=A0A6I9TK67_SESIN|nr:protein transport protein SEC16B homolog [Sesamum indicum]XP_020550570.1 protein transport protein SEC16B homolog [Sesamum indicum]